MSAAGQPWPSCLQRRDSGRVEVFVDPHDPALGVETENDADIEPQFSPHSAPAFTLRVYAHTMRDEESDLSFAEFGGSKRLYPALEISGDNSDSSNPLKRLARREGSAREQSSLCESTSAKPA